MLPSLVLLRTAARPPVASVAVGLGLVVAAAVIAGQRHPGMDSAVYNAGALAILRGEPLYGSLHIPPPWADLQFIYPPVAAILFIPLAPLPLHIVWGVMAAVCALCLGIGVRVTLRTLLRREPSTGLVTLLALVPFALQPVWSTVGLGQINLFLMALVIVDVLALKGSRYSGVLVGVAAAIKLTPLIFILHLLLTGRRADAARATATFLGLQGIGWAVLPADSWHFWSGGIFEGTDGRTYVAANQSLNGLIQRLTGEADFAFATAVALGVVCLAVHAIVVLRLHRHGQALAALLASAFCGLLVSPVTWTHHWVWVVPLCLLLGWRAVHRKPAALTLLPLVIVAFSVDFRLFVPIGNHVELKWTMVETLVGNAYLVAALVIGTVAMVLVTMRRPALALPDGALLSPIPSQRPPDRSDQPLADRLPR